MKDREIGDKEGEYYIIAQEIVTNNLKSPKSADFPSLSSGNIGMSRKKSMVAVSGYVDADNSFGTSIRTQFLVEFTVKDLDNFSYIVNYVKLDDQSSEKYVELN